MLAKRWSKLYKKKLAKGLGNLALPIVLCIPKGDGDVNLPKDEVLDGFLSCLVDDMVVEGVLEERVSVQATVVEQSNLLLHEVIKDEASKAMVDEDWHGESGMECMPFEGPTTDDMLGKHVGLAMQQ
ncbi:hypothetical protein L7F22_011400, partial [Adiantum nelumboides]|nr:hypothetical protein [Adiantum nelumboides]